MSALSALPSAKWQLPLPASRAQLLSCMAEFEVSPMLAQVLCGRGLTPALLAPELRLTPNAGLREAALRLVRAIKAGKRIRIHGDYDADGVSATAALVWGLRELGANVHGFIPHRLKEGYGVHPDKLDDHAQSADLLLTVDCGVTNLEEVRGLLKRGLEVIVTDHHSPGPDFPDCLVVHPHLTQDYTPAMHNLTGAGVAYHLLWATRQAFGLCEAHSEPRHLSPLATLGTVADVAPLLGENRALVKAGLQEFSRSALPGIRALMGNRSEVSARDVAYQLAPRLNAAGRMGEAGRALKLLSTTSMHEAQAIALDLDQLNAERRELQDRMFAEALHLADPSQPALVLTKDDWHPGVMGIVASKLLETHFKPVYIVAAGKGSVRSTPGISAVEGLRFSHDLLRRYGGHPAAAGFALEESNFGAFRARIHQYATQFPQPVPRVLLDAPLPAYSANLDLLSEIQRFEPFGEGNPAPLWHLRGELSAAKLIGKAEPKITLGFQVGGVRAVKFQQPSVPEGQQDLALHLQVNTFQGRDKAEFMTEALRPVAALEVSSAALQGPPSVLRLDPSAATSFFKGGAAAYASGAVAAYLQRQGPGGSLLSEEGNSPGAVILYDLPPEDTLKRWLSQGSVTFAWGPRTLDALEGAGPGTRPVLTGRDWRREEARQQAADAYRRWQWAHLYRCADDAGFAVGAYALLGGAAQALRTPAKEKVWAAN